MDTIELRKQFYTESGDDLRGVEVPIVYSKYIRWLESRLIEAEQKHPVMVIEKSCYLGGMPDLADACVGKQCVNCEFFK